MRAVSARSLLLARGVNRMRAHLTWDRPADAHADGSGRREHPVTESHKRNHHRTLVVLRQRLGCETVVRRAIQPRRVPSHRSLGRGPVRGSRLDRLDAVGSHGGDQRDRECLMFVLRGTAASTSRYGEHGLRPGGFGSVSTAPCFRSTRSVDGESFAVSDCAAKPTQRCARAETQEQRQRVRGAGAAPCVVRLRWRRHRNGFCPTLGRCVLGRRNRARRS